MKDDIKLWWKQAEEDYDAAVYNFEGKQYKVASFLCQQAAEKALKTVLLKKTGNIIKVHDLVLLGEHVGIDSSLREDCKRLTLVYTDTRYPTAITEKYTKEEVKEDLRSSQRILQWAEKKI